MKTEKIFPKLYNEYELEKRLVNRYNCYATVVPSNQNITDTRMNSVQLNNIAEIISVKYGVIATPKSGLIEINYNSQTHPELQYVRKQFLKTCLEYEFDCDIEVMDLGLDNIEEKYISIDNLYNKTI